MAEHSENKILNLADQFRNMEVKHDLFNLQSQDGIYYWDVLRYNVHLILLSEKGLFPNSNNNLKKKESKFKFCLKTIKLILLTFINEIRLFTLLKKEKKYVFLLNSRFQEKNGDPADLLIKDLYNQLKKDSFDIEMFRHKNFSWIKGNNGRRYFLYKLELSYLFGKNQIDDWSRLEKIINIEHGVNIQWGELFNAQLNRYRKEFIFFSQLLKKINPKILFFQFSPKGMVAAANALNITTVDIQHGVTNNAVINYYYPHNIKLEHIPSIANVFLTLGEFWNKYINVPSKKITLGNSYYFVEQDTDVKYRKGIMVVSVIFNYEFLKMGTATLAKKHPDKIFYFKLHSGQKHHELDCRSYFKMFHNVIVVYTEKNVNEIMNECFAVVLIQSSVAYQALQKGLKVFILKKDYYQISSEIFDLEKVHLVEDWETLSICLNQNNDESNFINSPVFFEPFQPTKMEDVIHTKILD